MLHTMQSGITLIGANGYLGQHVMRALAARGRKVTGISRSAGPTQAGLRSRNGDMSIGETSARLLAQTDTVINCAHGGLADTQRMAANLVGWLNQAAGRRLIHISSLAVFGQQTGCFNEHSAAYPRGFHRYARVKLAAERILLPQPQNSGARLIIRVGCLYGRNAPDWFDRIARLLMQDRLGLLAEYGEGQCHLIHAADVAAAIADAVEDDIARHGVVHLLHPEPITWNGYFLRLVNAIGLPAPTPITRTQLLADAYGASPLRRLAAKFTGSAAPLITPQMAAMFNSQARIVSRVPALLAPGRFTPHEAGITDAARHFRDSYFDAINRTMRTRECRNT